MKFPGRYVPSLNIVNGKQMSGGHGFSLPQLSLKTYLMIYIRHFSNLSSTMHILLSEKISKDLLYVTHIYIWGAILHL